MSSEPLDLANLDEQIHRLAMEDTDALRDLALALADELAQAEMKAVAADARGYAWAVAALRDDVRYVRWHHDQSLAGAGAHEYVPAADRLALASYLEVSKPEGGEPA